jgi:hypothetical protein
VPVIALAQLSRQDAIIFVYREAYYLERSTGATKEQEAARVDRLLDAKDDFINRAKAFAASILSTCFG